ncbi:MAG: winged helix-turn-helix transcriptional regulator [Methylocella sp.]
MRDGDTDYARIMLGLLDSVERNGAQSQRRLASELGIALGLVNAYLKRCIAKGLVKAREVPARRYVYYLTARGFAEKARLTVDYLVFSFDFFRQAKTDCAAQLEIAQARGFQRIVLAGKSDLAEIAAICALQSSVVIVGIIDQAVTEARYLGLPLFKSFKDVTVQFDAILITDLATAPKTCETAVQRFGAERVLIPSLLRVRHEREEQA